MSKDVLNNERDPHTRERLGTPTDLKAEATRDISAALAGLLADVFAHYLKTKSFPHWHMTGPHFHDYHLLLDEQGEQIFDMTDPGRRAARKISARPAAQSGISREASVYTTTTPTMSIRRTCSPSCAKITSASPR